LRLCTGFHKIRINISNFQEYENSAEQYTQYAVATVKVKEEAERIAMEQEALVIEYLKFCNLHPSSEICILDALIAAAKFVHRFETRESNKNDFSDIPIIKQLKDLRRRKSKAAQNAPSAIPNHLKSIGWEEVFEVLEILRKEATLTDYECESVLNGATHRRKRLELAVAKSFQRFLILALIVARPPDRSRTYRELEEGKTLKWGTYNGQYTPEQRLKDEKPALLLHLGANDYKTGKTYGEFWGEFPNIKFPDGTLLYDYIKLWLTKYRQVFNPQHSYFFTQPNGKPFSTDGFGDLIRRQFYRLTGVPVTPKEFRSMYVTYLKDQEASEAQLEAAAYEQHHSREMQSKMYDKQEKYRKSAPIRDFNQTVVARIYKQQP
jgi:hypothetical protein